jgi:hypothetical protein
MTPDPRYLREAEKIGLEIGLSRGEEMNREIEGAPGDKNLLELYRKIVAAR